MIGPAQILRVIYINLVLLRHGLDEVILAAPFFRPIRWLMYLTPWYWLRGKRAPRGVRIRRTLEDLGPIFVKFGQLLSTRRDLLADDIAEELNRLQDRVPPFSSEQARKLIETAYGRSVPELFSYFEDQPLASASIAQVHAARLHDGRDVVVKVLRPNVDKVIRRDVELMYYMAGLAQRYWREGRRLRPVEVVQEFEQVISDELDLVREAGNAAQLRRNFEGSEMLYVPEPYWPYARRNVIVMERISGIPISNIQELIDAGVDLKTLAEHGVEIFYTQVFRHNFFHADMHPGNVFVAPNGQYIAVDFGIMGTLNPEDQRYLAENFLAFFNRDYRRVAELHLESGWVPPDTRVDQFESAIRTVCEPNFNRPLKDISFGQVLLRLFQTARRFDMEVQPQLVLLQKTLLNIEGLGRQLYPDLDLWSTAKPFLERWMSEQIGARAFGKRLRDTLPVWSEKLPELPALMHKYLQKSVNGQLQTHQQIEHLNALRRDIRRANQRTVLAVIGAGLLISASALLGLGGIAEVLPEAAHLGSWILGGAGAILMLVAALRR